MWQILRKEAQGPWGRQGTVTWMVGDGTETPEQCALDSVNSAQGCGGGRVRETSFDLGPG